jgi:CubicO group peptidase (beta-lactamase class C family)
VAKLVRPIDRVVLRPPVGPVDGSTSIGARRGAVAWLVAIVALGPALATCASPIPTGGGPSPTSPASSDPSAGAVVLDDFEAGDLADWRVVDSGAGEWFVYSDGAFSPDPVHSAIMAEHRVADPPQGTFAVSTDTNGPGAHILYRDVRLDGKVTLRATVFYASANPLSAPGTFAYDRPGVANQQFRIDILSPTAPIDSVAAGDVLATLFRTADGDPASLVPTAVSLDLSPWTGQTVRIRVAKADNVGPFRVGVDDIRFEPSGSEPVARVELLSTPAATTAVDLVLDRLSEAEALAALQATAAERAETDIFSGALLVARDGTVLLKEAWGLADREAGTPNTPDSRFRLGSMNKMFTAVAILQLVEGGVVRLDDPIGTYLPDYPNQELASSVTVRHLLSHTGGTGDIFGAQFNRQRLELREHSDYLELYGSRSPAFEPGSHFAYSNYGFVLLGAIIEAETGKSYYDYVRARIFEPLGMTATDSLAETDDVPDRATGYMRPTANGALLPNTDTLPWRGTAAGGGYSTVGDMLRFAEGLRRGSLISEETLTLATTAQSVEPYGFGFELRGEGTMRSIGHGGGAPGMNGDLRIFPELGYVVVGLSNFDPPAASDVVEYFVLRMPAK